MSYEAAPRRIDPILLRLPAALWSALPRLVVAGALFMLALVASSGLPGGFAVLAPLIAAVLTAVPTGWAMARISTDVFDAQVASPAVRYGRALLLIGGPGATVSLTACAAMITPTMPAFSFVSIVGVVLTGVAVLVVSVALPLSTVRSEALSSILVAAFYAVARRPIPPVAVLVALGAATWASTTWAPSALVLIPAVAVVLSFAAAWTVLPAVGVRLPELAPVTSRALPTITHTTRGLR
ncbi:hypothetical protein GCM10025768_03710 [Microbacterium pseudoresistens]|uniref:Fumarate reductase subunit D n=1 Tax=Microbacterium pseudoresistens TaxID=640634 RepID=A0A7Y9EUI0_9MICO|nr:hypothetical protein [Microbacterium pseudoresistens]NYD54207.1 fumarate reductase subunit D [Microbacterium pseudoresistens]